MAHLTLDKMYFVFDVFFILIVNAFNFRFKMCICVCVNINVHRPIASSHLPTVKLPRPKQKSSSESVYFTGIEISISKVHKN